MANQVFELEISKSFMRRGQHIIEALLHFHRRDASQQRDRLYSLMGLQTIRTPTPVRPNYDVDLKDVYCVFAADMVQSWPTILLLCLDLTHSSEQERLPSWVPDWSRRNVADSYNTLSRFTWSQKYDAAKGLQGNPKVEDGYVLAVNGIEFDWIVKSSLVFRLTGRQADPIDTLSQWKRAMGFNGHSRRRASRFGALLQRKITSIEKAQRYPGGGSLDEAFWYTMLAGRCYCNDTAHVATPEDIKRLQEHLEEKERLFQHQGEGTVSGINETNSSHIVAVLDRRLVRTLRGYISIVPDTTTVGDLICVVGDCPAPIVLQPYAAEADNGRRRYRAFGHCYVHVIMYGEAMHDDLPQHRMLIC
jgi:hypothetical protein